MKKEVKMLCLKQLGEWQGNNKAESEPRSQIRVISELYDLQGHVHSLVRWFPFSDMDNFKNVLMDLPHGSLSILV